MRNYDQPTPPQLAEVLCLSAVMAYLLIVLWLA